MVTYVCRIYPLKPVLRHKRAHTRKRKGDGLKLSTSPTTITISFSETSDAFTRISFGVAMADIDSLINEDDTQCR